MFNKTLIWKQPLTSMYQGLLNRYIDILNLAKKIDLTTLELDLEKWDIEKLETGAVDLSKQSNVVKKHFIKKSVYDELVQKKILKKRVKILIRRIADTSKFVTTHARIEKPWKTKKPCNYQKTLQLILKMHLI